MHLCAVTDSTGLFMGNILWKRTEMKEHSLPEPTSFAIWHVNSLGLETFMLNMSFARSAGQEKCSLTSSVIIHVINSLTPNDLEGVYLKPHPSLLAHWCPFHQTNSTLVTQIRHKVDLPWRDLDNLKGWWQNILKEGLWGTQMSALLSILDFKSGPYCWTSCGMSFLWCMCSLIPVKWLLYVSLTP